MPTKRQRVIAEEETPLYSDPSTFWEEPIMEVYSIGEKGEWVDINRSPDSEAIKKAEERVEELKRWIDARRRYEQSKK